MRVGFARDAVRQVWNPARMRRRGPAGKACHGEIETPPEEMHRTRLAEKTGSEPGEHVMRSQQHAPEALRVFTVVGCVRSVFGKRYRLDRLVRRTAERCFNPQPGKRRSV